MDELKVNLLQAKKSRDQTFCDKYKQEFPVLKNSKVLTKHTFCKTCKRDLCISHGVGSDITQNMKTNFMNHLHHSNHPSQLSNLFYHLVASQERKMKLLFGLSVCLQHFMWNTTCP